MDTLLLIASLVLPQVHIRFKLTQRIFLLVLQEPSPSQCDQIFFRRTRRQTPKNRQFTRHPILLHFWTFQRAKVVDFFLENVQNFLRFFGKMLQN